MKSFLKRSNIGHIEIVSTDLELPGRQLSVRSLGFVVNLTVRLGIVFLCASTGVLIQL